MPQWPLFNLERALFRLERAHAKQEGHFQASEGNFHAQRVLSIHKKDKKGLSQAWDGHC